MQKQEKKGLVAQLDLSSASLCCQSVARGRSPSVSREVYQACEPGILSQGMVAPLSGTLTPGSLSAGLHCFLRIIGQYGRISRYPFRSLDRTFGTVPVTLKKTS